MEEETLHGVSRNEPQTTCQNCPAKDTAIPVSVSSVLLFSPGEICWLQKHTLSSFLCWESYMMSSHQYQLIISQTSPSLHLIPSSIQVPGMSIWLAATANAVAAWGLWNRFSFLVSSTWKWNLVASNAGPVWNNPVYCVRLPPHQPTSLFTLSVPASAIWAISSCLSKNTGQVCSKTMTINFPSILDCSFCSKQDLCSQGSVNDPW